jgi:hypothetical protein
MKMRKEMNLKLCVAQPGQSCRLGSGGSFVRIEPHRLFVKVAQLVEQLTSTQQVAGSIPVFYTLYRWPNGLRHLIANQGFTGSNPVLYFIGNKDVIKLKVIQEREALYWGGPGTGYSGGLRAEYQIN